MRAVLFDLDGTLLDRRETFRRHVELQVQRLGDLFARVDRRDVDLIEAVDANGTTPREEFFRRVEIAFTLPTGSASRLRDDFEAHFPEVCVPAPNLRATLEALRDAGVKLGLITNGRVSMQGRKIDGLGIRHLLDAVVISEAVGVRKPDPRIFAHALRELEVDPATAAYVGDNPDADVAGARRSGLFAVWKRDHFWPEPGAADWVIDDLAEIQQLVLRAQPSRPFAADNG